VAEWEGAAAGHGIAMEGACTCVSFGIYEASNRKV
jgi:hypothetical protein